MHSRQFKINNNDEIILRVLWPVSTTCLYNHFILFLSSSCPQKISNDWFQVSRLELYRIWQTKPGIKSSICQTSLYNSRVVYLKVNQQSMKQVAIWWLSKWIPAFLRLIWLNRKQSGTYARPDALKCTICSSRVSMQQNEAEPLPHTYTKSNSKWTIELSVRVKAIKLLEEDTGANFHDPGFGTEFSDETPKSWATKEKTYTGQTSSKLKNFVLRRTPSRN